MANNIIIEVLWIIKYGLKSQFEIIMENNTFEKYKLEHISHTFF